MVHINNIVDKIYCINLQRRTDRKKLIINQAKKYNLKINFFKAIENKEGWKGCLRSHLNILKIAKKKKLKNVMIMEDDCKIIDKMEIDKKKIPKDWKMLYLGCNIVEILEDDQFSAINKEWVKMRGFTTHCMIINQTAYDELINLIIVEEYPIDVYYKEFYHKNKQCYVKNPMIATQQEGYSDIEKRVLKYHLNTVEHMVEIPDAPHNYNKETGDYKLILSNISNEKLPKISILTPTKNRKKLFPLAIHCFKNFIYPKEKIEWVIVDDSNDGTDLKDILPNDKRIKYFKINTKKSLTVAMKRNLCVKYSKNDILVNMDDDDYYTPESLLARVKVLVSNPKINMVGCGITCCYEMNTKKYFLSGSKTQYAEATMTFRKSFWEKRKFNNKDIYGEGINFIKNRKQECCKIPFSFVMCVINHKKNMTIGKRKVIDNKAYINYYDLPIDIIKILQKIH